MIQQYLVHGDIFQQKIIDPAQIPFAQSVADACQANLCGRYGSCWTCPPGVGHWMDLEKQVKSYQKAVVFSCKYELEDWFDLEGMDAAALRARQCLKEIMENLRRDGISFLALGCGSCNICSECTYPDAPCRFPEEAIVSVEACGINVVQLSKDIGIRYNNGENTVTYFSIILYNE